LKYDDYFKEEVVIQDEDQDKWVKLGDVIEYVKYISKKIDHEDKNGKYPFYNSSIINHLYCNEYTNNEKCLIINKVNGTGKSKIYYNDGPFSATSAVIIFKCKTLYNIKYIYYYLNLNISILESKYSGSDKKSLNNSNFEKILIPNLSIDCQEEIVKLLDEIYTDLNIDETIKYFKDKPIFNLLIEKKYDDFKDIIYLQSKLPFITSELEKIPYIITELEINNKDTKLYKKEINHIFNLINNININILSKTNLEIEE
jgi:hypothetical protein